MKSDLPRPFPTPRRQLAEGDTIEADLVPLPRLSPFALLGDHVHPKEKETLR